jgi:hypothetical protein
MEFLGRQDAAITSEMYSRVPLQPWKGKNSIRRNKHGSKLYDTKAVFEAIATKAVFEAITTKAILKPSLPKLSLKPSLPVFEAIAQNRELIAKEAELSHSLRCLHRGLGAP